MIGFRERSSDWKIRWKSIGNLPVDCQTLTELNWYSIFVRQVLQCRSYRLPPFTFLIQVWISSFGSRWRGSISFLEEFNQDENFLEEFSQSKWKLSQVFEFTISDKMALNTEPLNCCFLFEGITMARASKRAPSTAPPIHIPRRRTWDYSDRASKLWFVRLHD